MDLTTHLLMGNKLYKEVCMQTGINLDYWHYIYGNIKPDVHPQFIERPHFLKDSVKELVNYCEYIAVTPISIKEFSMALGIISHFICDYHCLYHSEGYRKKSTLEHILYEKKLSLSFIKKHLTHKIKITSSEAVHRSIGETINSSHLLYTKEAHHLSLDLQYALDTTLSVISRIIELSKIQSIPLSDREIGYYLLKAEGSRI